MTNKTIPETSGSYASRKFVLTLIGLFLITGMAIASIWAPIIPTILPTFSGAIMAVLSLYMTGNVMNKFVVGKQIVAMKKTDEDTK